MPAGDVLLAMGAKDTSLIAQGEYWRLCTPIFIHIGIIHFFFNNFGIYVIAPYIELVFGRWFFLLLYLGAGLLGNLFSTVFSLNVSAGASGALFGLMGAGFYLEYLTNKKIQQETGIKNKSKAFAFLVIANIAFGFIVPGIDNAAHIGGLLFGLLTTLLILSLRANRLHPPRHKIAIVVIFLTSMLVSTLLWLAISKDYAAQRYEIAGDESHLPELAYQHYTNSLRIKSEPHVHFKRGRLLALAGQLPEALADFRAATVERKSKEQLERFLHRYRQRGRAQEADYLEKHLYSSSI